MKFAEYDLDKDVEEEIINRSLTQIKMLKKFSNFPQLITLNSIFGESSKKFAGIVIEQQMLFHIPMALLYIMNVMKILQVTCISQRNCWLFLGTSGQFRDGNITEKAFIDSMYTELPLYEIMLDVTSKKESFHLQKYHETYPQILNDAGDLTDFFAKSKEN